VSVKQAAGFALAEVVIAAAIFAIGAMLVTGFYLTASGRAVLGRNVTAGALLAQQQIEVAQSKAYSNLSTLQGTETLDSLGNSTPGGAFTRVTTVIRCDQAPNCAPAPSTATLTQVQVAVSWSEPSGQKNVTVYTLRVSP
jgi:type II secretory pathway pseudopilin PulG